MFNQERDELDDRNDYETRQAVSKCNRNGVGLHSNENTRGIDDSTARELPPAASAVPVPRIPLWKRGVDVFCVSIAIPSLLPLMLVVVLLIKATSKGPVLFKQQRIGFMGRKFTVFKFRTMIVGADTAAHQMHVATLMEENRPMIKLDRQGDRRLIPVGLVLRASGLDELPQLINVLRGEMSLVGPRPCLPSEFCRYQPWQKERLHALPGLTGLWQVSGKNRLTFTEMIECDIKYVRNQSLWLDLKIMLKTISAVIAEVKDLQRSAPSAGGEPKH